MINGTGFNFLGIQHHIGMLPLKVNNVQPTVWFSLDVSTTSKRFAVWQNSSDGNETCSSKISVTRIVSTSVVNSLCAPLHLG